VSRDNSVRKSHNETQVLDEVEEPPTLSPQATASKVTNALEDALEKEKF